MATKTFKLGEVCRGGIITIETKGKQIDVIGKDWNHANGGRRSQQKNNKEWTRLTVQSGDENAQREIDDFLNDLTTSYHSGKIMDWIKTKIEFDNPSFW